MSLPLPVFLGPPVQKPAHSLFAIGLYTPPGFADTTDPNIKATGFLGPPDRLPPSAISSPIIADGGRGAPVRYVFSWYTLRAPFSVEHKPPASIGTDLAGAPSVRGYSTMTWRYNHVAPDYWYAFYRLWRQSRVATGPYTGHVNIVWPDPQTGQTQQASARWDNIAQVSRDVAMFSNIEFVFSHVSIDDFGVVGAWRLTG